MEKFDCKAYHNFCSEAYKKADHISIDLDRKLDELPETLTEKHQFIKDSIIRNEVNYENGYPYTTIFLEKNYQVFQYLEQIDNWEEFSAYDEAEDFAIYAVDFIKEDRTIAYIVSHYRAYGSEFGWVRE